MGSEHLLAMMRHQCQSFAVAVCKVDRGDRDSRRRGQHGERGCSAGIKGPKGGSSVGWGSIDLARGEYVQVEAVLVPASMMVGMADVGSDIADTTSVVGVS